MMERNCWVVIILILFIALFFGKIALNGIEYAEHKKKFEVKCKAKGGIMFVPKGVKGWPVIECRNSTAILELSSSSL